ncbi:hypothetical protein Fmac_030606 [Flemingia macrophylla]|uniref:Uncharacterized protein n=1 Tax=Flemingia macrophylla TaxID=520843 RepID=A0ABD1L0Y7_9FABA
MEMEGSEIAKVEGILGYTFKNKKLLEEALTHSSFSDAVSYERLEFIGDSILSLCISNYLYIKYPHLEPRHLSLLRAANVSTEKLARVAIRSGLHHFLHHNDNSILDNVTRFADALHLSPEPPALAYAGPVKAPKVLADIVESLTAAVYVDLGFDLPLLWLVVRHLMEPIATPDELEQQPQPVTSLFETCQKHGKKVDVRYSNKDNKCVANVFVDGHFLVSASSDHKYLAKLEAAKLALQHLPHLLPKSDVSLIPEDGPLGGKHKLHQLCMTKKWPRPVFRMEKESGPPHDKRFVCAVQLATPQGTFRMSGNEKSRVRDAENSAASLMILALQHNNYITL